MFVSWTLWSALMVYVGEPFSFPLVRALARVSAVLVPAVVYLHFGVKNSDDFWAFRKNWKLGLTVGAVISMGLFILIFVQNSNRTMSLPVGFSVWLNFIIFSPFVEELMFRRVILEYLKSRTTTIRAIIISSILFMMFHWPWWILSEKKDGMTFLANSVSLFLYGIVFSFAVHRTKSIWSALLPHWVNNLILNCFES